MMENNNLKLWEELELEPKEAPAELEYRQEFLKWFSELPAEEREDFLKAFGAN